jgi:hypothetical protein
MIRKLQALRSFRGATFAVGVFVATLFALAGEKAAYAQAQQFGDQGQLTFTAENLFGISFNRVSAWNDTTTVANTSTHYGFLYSNDLGNSDNLTTPRGPWIGGHYFVIPNLSVGGTLGIESTTQSVTRETGGTSTTTQGATTSGFVILPKAGYSLVLTPIMAFWFRGGLGFTRRGTSNPNNDNGSAFTAWFLSADALFVVTPVHAVGFYVGPQGNLSFTGSASTTTNGQTTSISASFQSFSIDVGVLANFNL